jgi:cell division protein FtsI (penicillin-binding protein 3)
VTVVSFPRPARPRPVPGRRGVLGPPPKDIVPRGRLVTLLVVLSLAFGGLVFRLVDVQGLSAERYAVYGESQRLHSIVLPAQRGSILDRNGAELAISVQRQTVWADPGLVRDPAGDARALAPVLGLPEKGLRDKLSDDASFVYLARKVEDPVAAAVTALKLPGVFMMDEPKRYQPSGSLAAGVVGSVDPDDRGVSGLELQYQKELTGRPGALLVERDPKGRDIAAGVRQLQPPAPGAAVVLTLDQAMQYEAESALAEQIVASKAKGGMVVVMDPRSGEILAMANMVAGKAGGPPMPSGDNMAVTRVFEPGSVTKLVTIAGAVEQGLVKGSTRLNVPDRMKVADATFTDDHGHEDEYWSVDEIMAESSNVGTIMIGQRLGKDGLDRYLRRFGLSGRTALEFPGEASGLLPKPGDWSGTSMGTIPIGQGIAVTALQVLDAYNTIANGGVTVPPSLVKGVVDAGGKVHQVARPAGERIVSPETAAAMTRMLAGVVSAGTGTQAAIPNYSVAGKTGTARKVADGGRGYLDRAHISTFVGFVPAEAPRLSAVVVLDEPAQVYAGIVSAPVFAKLALAGTRLFSIPPHPTDDAPLRSSPPAGAAAAAGLAGSVVPSPARA